MLLAMAKAARAHPSHSGFVLTEYQRQVLRCNALEDAIGQLREAKGRMEE